MEQEQVGRSPLRGSDHSAEPEPVPVSAASAASTPNAGYTPGPWELDDPEVIDRLEDGGMFEAAEELRRLQERFQNFVAQPLIAAAPEMFEALQEAIGALNESAFGPRDAEARARHESMMARSRAAIARATGAS